MRAKAQRAFTAVCVAVAASVIPLVAAAPASANGPDSCISYLKAQRDAKGKPLYVIGPKVKASCAYAGRFGMELQYCIAGLTNAGVRQGHAATACRP